jgi:DNA topoisomerase I
MPPLTPHTRGPRQTPEETARRASLRLTADTAPGIRRRKRGRMFEYRRPSGARVTDAATLKRVRRLAIPPAWTDVWISPDARAHIQATGRDARGRKQYRYHTDWHATRDLAKYGRLIEFARRLPAVRRRVRRDLQAPRTSRTQVLALALTLLDQTFIRVGNRAYTRANGSFGLTTLQDRHVSIRSGHVEFSFRGKSGKARRLTLSDAHLARLIAACRDIPGSDLFQYRDGGGRRRTLTAQDLNQYLGEISKWHFTAKDFRTWGGAVQTADCLHAHRRKGSGLPGKTAMRRDIETVAAILGNTPAICRKSYIHPALLQAYEDAMLWRAWGTACRRPYRPTRDLSIPERRLLRFLLLAEGAGAGSAGPGDLIH